MPDPERAVLRAHRAAPQPRLGLRQELASDGDAGFIQAFSGLMRQVRPRTRP
jgi:hypothetical protein